MSVMPSFGVALTVTIVMRKTALTSIVPCKKETRKMHKNTISDGWERGVSRTWSELQKKKKTASSKTFRCLRHYQFVNRRRRNVSEPTFCCRSFRVQELSVSYPLGNHNASELKEVFQPLETKRKKKKRKKERGWGDTKRTRNYEKTSILCAPW